MINSIIVLKSRQQWNHFLINKIKLFFNVEVFFLNENLNQSLEKIKIKLNNIILNNNIEIAFFEGDYLSLINYEFINDINRIKNLSPTNILLIVETLILTLLLIPKIIIKKLHKI